MEMPKQNRTMYDSILLNDQINDIYNNVIDDLTKQDISDEQTINALLASTSMGFNDLFNTLSRMIINAYIVDKYKNDNSIELSESMDEVINNTINVITKISKSVNNKSIKTLTEQLNVLMQEQQEGDDESTTYSEVDEDESEDLS